MASMDLLTRLAALHPDKTALIDDRPGRPLRVLDFAAFEAEVNRLCHVLLGIGLERGEKLIWCGPNSVGAICCIHAARKLGAAAVPLNYRLAPEEAAYVIDNSDARRVCADAEYVALMQAARPQCPKVRDWILFDGAAPAGFLELDAALRAAPATPPPVAEIDAPAPQTITYTSGTTGKPKGAVRRGLGDPEQVRALMQRIGYVPDDVYLTTGPLYHSGPGGFMALAQSLGNTVVIQRKFDAEDWLRLVERHRVTSTFAAPTPIRLVCQLPAAVKARYDKSSLKRMVANAAPWSQALKLAYLADFPEDSLWEVYGSTELGVNTVLAPADQRRKPGSCGQPAPGVEIRLFDDAGRVIDRPHVPGELFVRSRTVFETYYKAQEKFEADRRGDFQTVGDVAYFDEEGFYYICDRKKDMIISGGVNVYPAEIEAALEHHPLIADVAVIGIPSEEWGESVHAIVVPAEGAAPEIAEILAFAREHLAGYKVPRSLEFRDAIPRTGSGKILKRELRAPFWEGRASSVG